MIAKEELVKLRETSMRLLKGDAERDPVVRLFNKYHIPEGARLRRTYAELVDARAQIAHYEEHEARCQQEYFNMAFRLQALFRLDDDGDALPPADGDSEVARIEARMRRLDAYKARWKALAEDAERQASEAARNWTALKDTWRDLRWKLTGDEYFAPAFRVGEWERPSAAVRADLEAQLQRVES
jgi:hypothetical protein